MLYARDILCFLRFFVGFNVIAGYIYYIFVVIRRTEFDFCFLLFPSWKFFHIIAVVYGFVIKKQRAKWWVWRFEPI